MNVIARFCLTQVFWEFKGPGQQGGVEEEGEIFITLMARLVEGSKLMEMIIKYISLFNEMTRA